jgi:hypothetical protein
MPVSGQKEDPNPELHPIANVTAGGNVEVAASLPVAARKPLSWISKFFRLLGPGLVTGAADDDPSGIATYSQIGAQFGYGLLWTMFFIYPFMTSIQEISARLARVTGRGIAGNIRHLYPRWILYGIVGLLLFANIINIGADIGAMGAAANLLTGLYSLNKRRSTITDAHDRHFYLGVGHIQQLINFDPDLLPPLIPLFFWRIEYPGFASRSGNGSTIPGTADEHGRYLEGCGPGRGPSQPSYEPPRTPSATPQLIQAPKNVLTQAPRC